MIFFSFSSLQNFKKLKLKIIYLFISKYLILKKFFLIFEKYLMNKSYNTNKLTKFTFTKI